MRCPRCGAALKPYAYGGQALDVCPECRGIWFDRDELTTVAGHMIETGQAETQQAGDAINVRRAPVSAEEAEKVCPRCKLPMTAFNYAYDSNVFLDRCAACQGIWADPGEVETVARYLKGNPAVNRYAQSFMQGAVAERKQSWIGRLLRSRVLSGTVAASYIGAIVAYGDEEAIWSMVLFLLLPLACIWFSDAMGSHTGFPAVSQPSVSRPSPGILVASTGWIVLLLPGVIGAVYILLG